MEEGGGEGVGAPFNVLPPGATDLVAPLTYSIVTMYLVPFLRYSASNNGVTLNNSGLEVMVIESGTSQ